MADTATSRIGFYAGLLSLMLLFISSREAAASSPRNVWRVAGQEQSGVITGTVMTAGARPIVAINVRAIRVADLEGKPDKSRFEMERATDDRGIYRIYGLQPGDYIVEAGDSSRSNLSQYGQGVQTFYPSETRNTARQIRVDPGTETNAIDIIVRDDIGHTISGHIRAGTANLDSYRVSLHLFDTATGTPVYDEALYLDNQNNSFAIHGLQDGLYELYALSDSSMPGRFSIKSIKMEGADVEDLNVALQPFASVNGHIQVAPSTQVSEWMSCAKRKELSVGDVEVKAELDSPVDRRNLSFFNFVRGSANGDTGFTLLNLRTGLYRITIKPADDHLYLKSATLLTESANPPRQPRRPSIEKLRDIANEGLLVKAGEEIGDIVLTLGEDGPVLGGKLAISGGVPESAGVHVYLVPAEPDYANAISRYAETTAREDGTFIFTNIAPGRYLVAATAASTSGDVGASRPLAWDAKGRAELRKLTDAVKIPVELRACERLTNLSLPYQRLSERSQNK